MSAPRPASTRVLFGIPVQAVTIDDAVRQCSEAIRRRTRLLVGAVNAAKIVRMRRDPALRNAVLSADLIVADGASVVWASRVLGRPLPERVTGVDLFLALLDHADREGLGVYFLGARTETLERMLERVRTEHPGVRIAGAHHGYFDDTQALAIESEIRWSRPDMLFVGMTSPRKERFLATAAARLGVPVCHGVGGSFDLLAGEVRRAPEAWQQAGCEWLYRLLQEPRRLWRRYLVTNTLFMLDLLRELVRPRALIRDRASHAPDEAIIAAIRPERPLPVHAGTRAA